MDNVNNLLRQAKSFVDRNSPTILTCIGGVGVVGTAVLAATATPKALELLKDAREEKGEDLTKMEVVLTAGPAYIPAILAGASTIACIFGANIISKHQQASLVSAYALLDSSYKEYKKKVEELYGEDSNGRIREEIVRDKYDEEDISVDDRKSLFYDEMSDRYFEARMEDVLRAEFAVNRKISMWGGVTLNEFYEYMDVPPVEHGGILGWSEGSLMAETWGKWIDFTHKKVVMDDGLECYILSASTDPMMDYEYY